MFRNWCAIGIGTGLGIALFHCNSANAQPHSANAQQHEVPHHHAHLSFRRHVDHPQATAKKQKERDGAALLSLKIEIRDLRKQVADVELLRDELTDLKEKIWGPTPLPLTLSALPRPQSVAAVEPKRVTLKLPDFGEPYRPQAPLNPASAASPAVIEERAAEVLKAKSAVEEAKAYLIKTATPGYTMVRQGVPVAIGRLHADFVVKLAAAIHLARESGMTSSGIFSAYRPPAFGIGGFSDKFNSLHSYGLAADMTGIGGPGSPLAKQWQTIVRRVGLYLPYGADNRAEFNHTQLIPTKMAPSFLRQTITAGEPKDLQRMWLASGISSYVGEDALGQSPTLASASAKQQVASPAVTDAPSQPTSEPSTAPRRARRRRPGKSGTARIRVAPRSRSRKAGKSERKAEKTPPIKAKSRRKASR